MIRKTLLLIAAILPLCLKAQLGIGSWEIFPSYMTPERMVETPEKVYCLSAGTLMSFDKDTEETYYYGVNNVLSESGISNIYYNPSGKYLAVVYPSSNIDIIYDNGKVINLSDIKDAVMVSSRTINDIDFANGCMYVATNFGIVVYDDRKMEVKESGIYDMPVNYIGATDQYLAFYSDSPQNMYFIPIGQRINLLDSFIKIDCPKVWGGIKGLNGNKFIFGYEKISKASPAQITFDSENKTIEIKDYGYADLNCFYEYDGGFYGYTKSTLLLFPITGGMRPIKFPANIQNKNYAFWENPNEIWVGDSDGLGKYRIENDGSLTVLRDTYKDNLLSTNKVGFLKFSKKVPGRLYVGPYPKTDFYSGYWPSSQNVKQKNYVNIIEKNGTIRNVTPTNILDFWGNTLTTAHGGMVIEDPDDPNYFYWPLWYDNLAKCSLDDGAVVCYNAANSKIDALWYYRNNAIDIDRHGNLWVLQLGYTHMLKCLPANVRRTNQSTPDDWYQALPRNDIEYFSDGRLFASPTKDIILIYFIWSSHLYAYDTKGTADTSDDEFHEWTQLQDQDGKIFSVPYITAIHEDKKGDVWVTTESGVFVINDLDNALNPNMKVRRVKVPRNDGTNFADYLLDGETVLSIDTDNLNRKWLGTLNSGVYLVSEDGTSILEHYTTDNSCLPDNAVFAVACDPTSNAVYFGTTTGMVKYNSSAAPSADNLNNVYAFPNPVRPDYTGWITITGLMDGTSVKIADASGQVFYTAVSNGGIITWDGCNSIGERVRTGVYYVLASNAEQGVSESAVAKILVVK